MSFSEQTPSNESPRQEIPPEHWQALQARWKSITVLEVGIESLRLRLDSLRAQLEAAFKHSLGVEEKTHALQSDMAQWNKAKNRIHYALPKAREFIHRATWALGIPERKKLEELFKNHLRHRIPFPEVDKVGVQLDYLLKDRQVLSGHGLSVYQECKSISADVQGTLRTLQSNATANANRKRGKTRSGDKAF